MELVNKITDEKLNKMIKEVIGNNWSISPLTEVCSQLDHNACYQEWDMHLDEIIDGKITDHLHKRFTLFYLVEKSLETQLVIILNVISEGIELKKSLKNFNLYEFA